jgi:hypothetical protein
MADKVEVSLDAGSRIPDPPMSEEEILQWAKDLTEKLRNDHSDSVGRIENLIMSDKRTTNRPEPTGSKRCFYDEYEEIFYLDSLDADGNAKWKPINAFDNWKAEGLGVHVLYSSSLPVAGLTTGFFTWDEEAWDEDTYWPGSGNTITMPETRQENQAYQVEVFADITALAADKEILISAVIEGSDLTWLTEAHVIWRSDGNDKKLRLNFVRGMIEQDELQIGYSADGTFTLVEQYVIVTPVTLEVGGGGVIPTISDHGELSGLGDDDHLQYMLFSDYEASRAAFGTKWTDLTDGGETALHTHAAELDGSSICLNNNQAFQFKDSPAGICRTVLTMNAAELVTLGYSGGTLRLEAVSMTLESSAGAMSFTTSGSNNISINAGGETRVGSDLLITNNNEALQGRNSGTATYTDLIKKNANNEIQIGDSNASYDHLAIRLSTDGDIYLGEYGCQVRMEDSGSVDVDVMRMESHDHGGGAVQTLGLGSPSRGARIEATWCSLDVTSLFLTSSSHMVLETTGATADLTLDSGDVMNFTAADNIVVTTPMLDVSSGGKVRLPYADAGGHANGDIWMESDGLHIYYGGAEYTVAGV